MSAFVVLSVRATELFASRKVGRVPLTATVSDEEERLLSPHVTLYRPTNHRTGTRQVLQYLDIFRTKLKMETIFTVFNYFYLIG